MRRLAWFLPCLILLAGTQLANAGPQVYQGGEVRVSYLDRIVEQWNHWPLNPDPSTWAVNPTQCPWDPNDMFSYTSSGNIAAGVSVMITGCLIADPNPVLNGSQPSRPTIQTTLEASRPDLVATLCYQPAGDCFTATTHWSDAARDWDYDLCVRGPTYHNNASEVQPIEGSNGGYGVPTTYTLSITNPTSRKITAYNGLSNQNSDLPRTFPCRTEDTVQYDGLTHYYFANVPPR